MTNLIKDNNNYKIGGSKITSNMDHFEKWKKGMNVGPLVIEVSPTYGCNHGCLHCGFQQFDPYGANNIFKQTDNFKRFLSDFKSLGGVEVFFAGNGEPLLNPELPDWFQNGYNVGLDMSMSTNGVPFINRKKMEGILPFAKWIRFSVNGGTKEDYSKVHACSEKDFERLIQVLKNCATFKKDNDLDVQLIIQFIVYDLNWKSMQNIVDIHNEVGTDQLVFRKVIKDPSEERVHFNPNIMGELKKIKEENGVVIRWKSFGKQDDSLRWSKCSGINFRINMNHKGDLITCNRNLFKKSSFGNINEKSFIDIWNSNYKKKMFKAIEDQIGMPDCARFCQTSFDNTLIEQERIELN